LYGTTIDGGAWGNGGIFRLNVNGTSFTNLHSFATARTNLFGNYTNSEGILPEAGLVLSDNTLYGTTDNGGSSGNGTIFTINTDGTGYTNLHSFTDGGGLDAANTVGLVLFNNLLYGITQAGGIFTNGTVFRLNSDGSNFTNLHTFTSFGQVNYSYTNSDGAYPLAELILTGNVLYGTANSGGINGNGTIFALNADGTGFTNLHTFTTIVINTNSSGSVSYTNSGGHGPFCRLFLSGDTLYGTASSGGAFNNGTVFSLSLSPPPLAITRVTTNVILTWPTYAPGVALQSTTNLLSSNWNTILLSPVLVNGQNAVTNPISGAQMFYRLSQ